MIIGFCLAVMTVLSFLSVVIGGAFIGSSLDFTVDGSQVVNGTSSSFSINGITSAFSIDTVQGVIFWIIVIVTLASLIGLQILASGLDSEAVRVVQIGIGYSGLWGTLSILAFPLVVSIEYLGSILYLLLTFVYVIGVIQKGFAQQQG